jgi:site-specific DNA-methyltransferase (adenine-specific)
MPEADGAIEDSVLGSRHCPTFSVVRSDCLVFLAGLPDQSVDVIVTDPAYSGMNRHLMFGNGRIVGDYQSADNQKWFAEFHDDPATYRRFLEQCRRVLRNDRHLYLMFDSYSLLSLGALVRDCFDVKNVIVWDKVNLGMGHYFRRRHELIVFATKGRRKIARRDIPDIWRFPRIHPARYPTQKPVELFEAMLAGSVEPGDVVCDPFVGSGSSGVAALRRGCSFIGCDLSERAVEFSLARLEEFRATGRDPAQPKAARVEGESYGWLASAGVGARVNTAILGVGPKES